jgi:BSD domain
MHMHVLQPSHLLCLIPMQFPGQHQLCTLSERRALPQCSTPSGVLGSVFSPHNVGMLCLVGVQISAMQRNSATYCDEPADGEAFSMFLEAYEEEARSAQSQEILSSNPFMSELHSRLVPLVITDDTFWQRYFFRHSPLLLCSLFCATTRPACRIFLLRHKQHRVSRSQAREFNF